MTNDQDTPGKETRLSTQETRVLTLASQGRIDKEICAEMRISLGTVRVYWKRIRAKHDNASRSEVLVAFGGGKVRTAATDSPSVTFEAEVTEFLAQAPDGTQYTGHSIELPINVARDGDRVRVTVRILPSAVEDDEGADDSETADGMHRRAA